MAAEFDEIGFHFLYPENWTVSREESTLWPRCVSVHSPSGALWSVTADRRPVDETMKEIVEAMRNEYEQFEDYRCSRDLAHRQLEGYELLFYCLDLLIKAHVLGFQQDQVTTVLIYQAENREFDELLKVFDAMSTSLLSA